MGYEGRQDGLGVGDRNEYGKNTLYEILQE